MSYAAAVALQAAVYQHLLADDTVQNSVGDAIYDAMPVESPQTTFISLGPEQVTDAGDYTARGSRHEFVISVISGADGATGFKSVKQTAAAVTEALEAGTLRLSHGHLAGIWLLRARARRAENGDARRVDLTFRARIDLG